MTRTFPTGCSRRRRRRRNPVEKAAVGGMLLLLLISWVGAVAAKTKNDNDDTAEDACKLYMAPSSTSTSTEPMWGLYAGIDYDEGELLDNFDLGVNVYNLRAHNGLVEDAANVELDEEQQAMHDMVAFLEGFLWVPEPAGAKMESLDPKVTYIPGMGILSAMNAKLTNAQWNHRSAYHRPLLGEQPGTAHAGRGAYTPFYNVAISTLDSLKAGTEIFLSYGANYAEENNENGEEGGENELTKSDYEKLDETIAQMMAFFDKHADTLDETAVRQIYQFLSRDVMTAAVGTKRQRQVARLLPPHPQQLADIVQAGGAMKYDQKHAFRTVSWLQASGYCADSLQQGASRIPHAGRGALARRNVAAGDTIAATPLIPIPTARLLEMHPLEKQEVDGGTATFTKLSDDVTGWQLLLNYCWGHAESSLVFLPAGMGVSFINHDATSPNAKMVWSSQTARSDWFQVPPEELIDESDHAYMGLLMEIVALRDISPGEEVVMDYGPEWQAAWDAHVQRHQQQQASSQKTTTWPPKAVDWNDEYQRKPHPTEKEQKKAPYPDHLALMGFIMIKETTAAGTLQEPKEWDVPEAGTVFDAENLFAVTVVDRHKLKPSSASSSTTLHTTMPYNYTIRWLNVMEEATYVINVPHDALVVVDQPGTSDHFAPHAFRHPIGIPDDVFPQGPWRNLLGDDDEDEEASDDEEDDEEEE